MKTNTSGRILLLFVVVGSIIVLLMANFHSDPLPEGVKADRIEVYKKTRTLELWSRNRKLKTYTIMLGRHPVGPKRFEGDGRTPEGNHVIDYRNPRSKFHLSLHISYPDSRDMERARALNRPAGGMIMVHGLRNGLGWLGAVLRPFDWTDGCIAVTNPEIEEIWRAVPNGVPIRIHP